MNLKPWQWHIFLWTVYVLFRSVRDLAFFPGFLENLLLNIMICLVLSPFVYWNYYQLIPNLFIQRRRYAEFTLITLVCSVALGWAINRIIFLLLNIEFFQTIQSYAVQAIECFTLVMVVTIIRVVRDTRQKEARLLNMKEARTKSELSALRGQVNPHTLFNVINNVYHLIPSQPKNAQNMLMHFSSLLSHQLYLGNKQQVTLREEIAYISDYVFLEKIRQGEGVQVIFNAPENSLTPVPPLLFIPFVENAFKHGFASGLPEYRLTVSLEEDDHFIYFHCENEYQQVNEPNKKGGLGLKNIRRRLELLYPDRHELTIEDHENRFDVRLKLGKS